jgi:ABC-2 type transport system ATP-binding protein
MLQGMIARGATIFLTSHVLEIVERLCSHIAIIDHGRIVVHGSLEELRAGVQAKLAGESHELGSRLTLEQIFLSVVGKDSSETAVREGELAWLS